MPRAVAVMVPTAEVLTWGTSDVWDGNYGEPQYLHPEAMGWVLGVKWSDVLDWEEYDDLRLAIQDRGIRAPLQFIVWEDRKILVDGHHRLVIARELGIPTVPVQQTYDTRNSEIVEFLREWKPWLIERGLL